MRGGKRLSAHVGAYFTWEFPNYSAIAYHGSDTPRRQVLPLGNKKIAIPKDDYFFGDPERTRTVDLQRDRLAC